MLGHSSKRATKVMGDYLDMSAKGKLELCESCAFLAKAPQKNVPKIGTGEKATEPNGRWYTNQSQLKPPEGIPGTKTTWSIVVAEYTNLGVSAFYAAKDKMIEPFCV